MNASEYMEHWRRKRVWKRLEDPGHLRLYSERSLARLLAGLKFRIERAGRFFYVVIVIGGKT